MRKTQVQSLGSEDPLEKGLATHSSIILAWRIPWTEEPGGLQSMRLQRAGHDWGTNTSVPLHTYNHLYHLRLTVGWEQCSLKFPNWKIGQIRIQKFKLYAFFSKLNRLLLSPEELFERTATLIGTCCNFLLEMLPLIKFPSVKRTSSFWWLIHPTDHFQVSFT